LILITIFAMNSATNTAQYLLYGLSAGTTSINSSIDSPNQPVLRFPSKQIAFLYCLILHQGDVNPSDSANDPDIYPQGIQISHSKYVVVSDRWQGAGSGVYVFIWFYNSQGEFGSFVDIDLDVSHSFHPIPFNKLILLIVILSKNIGIRISMEYVHLI
jgi:hypothetical protein